MVLSGRTSKGTPSLTRLLIMAARHCKKLGGLRVRSLLNDRSPHPPLSNPARLGLQVLILTPSFSFSFLSALLPAGQHPGPLPPENYTILRRQIPLGPLLRVRLFLFWFLNQPFICLHISIYTSIYGFNSIYNMGLIWV